MSVRCGSQPDEQAVLGLMGLFARVDVIRIGTVMDNQDLDGSASQSDVDDKAPGFLLGACA